MVKSLDLQRIVKIKTPNYTNDAYKKAKKTIKKHNDKFYDRYTIFKSELGHDELSIELIGFDGEIKKTYKSFNYQKIIKDIDAIP